VAVTVLLGALRPVPVSVTVQIKVATLSSGEDMPNPLKSVLKDVAALMTIVSPPVLVHNCVKGPTPPVITAVVVLVVTLLVPAIPETLSGEAVTDRAEKNTLLPPDVPTNPVTTLLLPPDVPTVIAEMVLLPPLVPMTDVI
jgi:hypothetical protein